MYSEKLEELIRAALADGVLTDKEKKILFKRAQEEGIDLDEFEMVLSARVIELDKAKQSSIANDNHQIETYRDLSRNAVLARNYVEAENYSNKILEIVSEDPEAWLNKGYAAGALSQFPNMRYNEMVQCFQNALDYAGEDLISEIKRGVILGLERLPVEQLIFSCEYLKKGNWQYINNVRWLMQFIYQQACHLILSCSGNTKDMMTRVANTLNSTAIEAFDYINFYRFNTEYAQWHLDGTKICHELLETYAAIPEVSNDEKIAAYKMKIDISKAWKESHPVMDAILGYDPFHESMDEVIKHARSMIRKLSPPKPKKTTDEAKPKKPASPPKPITWDKVKVTDNPNDTKRLVFDSEIKKSYWLSGWATQYGINKAVEKIQKAAAERGCCLALITDIDNSFTTVVTASLFKKNTK